MNPERTRTIYGAPGTGKTTRLMSILGEILDRGTNPQQIAYLSFTRKAGEVARNKARTLYGLSSKDMSWFRTLHSLAFKSTGIQSSHMIEPSEHAHLAETLGYKINMTLGSSLPSDLGSPYWKTTSTTRNPYQQMMSVIERARIRRSSLNEERGELLRRDFTLDQLLAVSKAYSDFKADNYLYDYTDLLDKAVTASILPKLEIIFVDEAQDLSLLQWDLVEALTNDETEIYIAGDDDQAIYRWAGANVDRFITMPGQHEVLPKSYRVPSRIQQVAQQLIHQINFRQEKHWKPVKTGGTIERFSRFESLDLAKGEWLILGRNKHLLKNAEEYCKTQGFGYMTPTSNLLHSNAIKALKSWNELQNGGMITEQNAGILYSQIKPPAIRRPGSVTGNHTWESFTEMFGILVTLPLMDLFSIRQDVLSYYLGLQATQDDTLTEPRIKISTIHQAKGGEADNVLLLSDISRTTHSALSKKKYLEDEYRVFYVAVTRARERLFVQTQQKKFTFPGLQYALNSVKGE